jgi:hypothetical protein
VKKIIHKVIHSDYTDNYPVGKIFYESKELFKELEGEGVIEITLIQ